MLKKSLAIILSTALALGILVQGSFAYSYPQVFYDLDDVFSTRNITSGPNQQSFAEGFFSSYGDTAYYKLISDATSPNVVYCICSYVPLYISTGTNTFYSQEQSTIYVRACKYSSYSDYTVTGVQVGVSSWYSYYLTDWRDTGRLFYSYDMRVYNSNFVETSSHLANFDDEYYVDPDTRYLDAYISGSTYGDVKFLAIQTDDVILSSTWISIRYHINDGLGLSSTHIVDYPFDFVTSGGYSIIKINPNEISPWDFTVESVLFSGSPSWGYKELTGLSLRFNESVLPPPIPFVSPVPDYSYYDTTYINYNGGNPEIIYTPISSDLEIGFFGIDTNKFYFRDYPGFYLEQPFSYSFIVIPEIQYEYSSFLYDCLYQFDVVIDDFEIITSNQIVSFDYIYGSGAWSNLSSVLSAAQVSDVSSVLEAWYSTHDPVIYQYPFGTDEAFNIDGRVYSCSLIITDSFFFKQTNYLLGDTSDILSEFSERFFKIDGFSDSLFDNISSLYNLNLLFYDSALQQLTGLSYWLNENDISNNLVDILGVLSSMDSYLSSVDGKLNYLVTIDSDLNDLLEWFQNQEDSDVVLTLPDFNPSILINIYGANIGNFVEFVQGFVNTLPEFDFSDFPNFFDYAADLVDDTAGSGDDLIGSLFNPYDYDDSGLHEFGWD